MSELLPSREAAQITEALTDFLATTFALSDEDARAGLTGFLADPDAGIFRGPYVRARVPFRAAETGWRDSLEWYEGPVPYGHQADAFRRLTSFGHEPEPTLVVTGTGSGKTEAFLYPILDHVLRAAAAGQTGVSALILYPMNALANDQARRLAAMIRGRDALKGVRAALYTGEQAGSKRTRVTADGLITDRDTIHDEPPQLLLTNYKMLDQLLLRPVDAPLIASMAAGLRYLVLDEFHTYDGAQGTDVAMLLRRLGLALRRLRPADRPLDAHAAGLPLLDVTPVATSATLGDEGDPAGMLAFAQTVFGRPFEPAAVVTETRQSARSWVHAAQDGGAAHGGVPRPIDNALARRVAGIERLEDGDAATLTSAVLNALFDGEGGESRVDWAALSAEDLLASVAAHPISHAIAAAAEKAVSLDDLATTLLGAGLGPEETFESRRDTRRIFLTRVLAALSHVRARAGRGALGVDLHLWVRELTRIDRAAHPVARFSWADDGPAEAGDDDAGVAFFPAVYCRNCGRSGWGIELAPVGDELAGDDESIRRHHAARDSRSRFRALLHAPTEADTAAGGARAVDGLVWFDPQARRILATAPLGQDAETALPVLTLTGDDVDDRSRDDECPACGRTDGIRFLGSAMATMLSVIVTTLFGDAQLDITEKKALVFTDSVQDAAHRAGFVQARAHVFALRNAIRRAVGDQPTTLEELVTLLVQGAGDDRDARYRLLAPDIVDRDHFSPFWSAPTLRSVKVSVLNRVKQRLLFDVELEFGLLSRVGRTLELTGSLTAGVEITDEKAEAIGRRVLTDSAPDGILDSLAPAQAPAATVVRWVRGVLERMRERGGLEHDWLTRYIAEDGRRWRVWGGRPRGSGMPAFPPGREAPAFPRVGPRAPAGTDAHRTHLDVVSSSQSWFATWARRVLGVTAADSAALTRVLLTALAQDGLLHSQPIGHGEATAYLIPPAAVTVVPVSEADLASGATRLECDVCHNPVTGMREAAAALDGGPCTSARCPGTLRRAASGDNYYRSLYNTGVMRRVVAREHTSLLDAAVRLAHENGFKAASADPSAPNVLVATPTLEMGIDIGDLSTVMLAGLPRRTASYLQRVGRAGRLTGNALALAAVTGRGDQLPRMGDPLSVINGAVRPPATFLDAREIVQRQYLASLLDRRTADPDATVTRADEVLASSEPGTLLGDTVADAEQHAGTYAGEFLAALQGLSESARDHLVAFATPAAEPGSSPLAAAVRDAVQRWNRQLNTLSQRRKQVADALPDLQAAAERNLEEDARPALNAARATHRLLGAQLNRLRTEYWIAALERFGLLPNYTLLDDTVTLDAAVSWVDPDTDQWQDDTFSYQRGAAVAIHELAPGSYFYAQGLEIPIDAVDLGVDGEAVREWSFCPACGYARPAGEDTGSNACPRCDAVGLNDLAQRLRVVEVETVSALARRDEAAIGDRDDERRRTRFTVQVAADLDRAGVAREWFDEESGFGVTYARDLTVRWLNLGRQGVGGETRVLAGSERTAPLFRVCDTCGKLDSQAGGNDRRDHRSWCPRRLGSTEHTIAIALSRTLTTQGAFLRLPPAVTLGDSLAVPSLGAALLRGLRELMGGDPDHLRVVAVAQPAAGGGSAESLLVHDAVPGGTGYLAELADPERMHELLVTAWRVVRDCPCQAEGRAACHRCLMPYAAGDTSRISRASAQQTLALLLRVNDGGEPQPFVPTEHDPGVTVDESVIEQLFRKRFIERVTALGGTTKEIPGDWGNKVQVSFPGDGRIWMLRPQVPLGFTTPDFVLDQHGGGAKAIAIYTDGRAFHASVAHNRLADDAQKRAGLRQAGYRVLAVTWEDLAGDGGLPDGWLNPGWAAQVAAQYQLPLAQLERLHRDPLTSLMKWMQDPASEARRRETLARALPMMLGKTPSSVNTDLSALSPIEAAAAALRGEELPSGNPTAWVTRLGSLTHATRMGQNGDSTFSLVLDDGPAALQTHDFAGSWRLWLRLSNLIGWRDDLGAVDIRALSQVPTPGQEGSLEAAEAIGSPAVAVAGPPAPLTDDWAALAALATADEAALLHELAALNAPLPTLGVELADGIPVSFAWHTAHVAAAWGLDDRDQAALTAAGWTVVAPEKNAIAAALAQSRPTAPERS